MFCVQGGKKMEESLSTMDNQKLFPEEETLEMIALQVF
jgi:hypothetical protein